MKACVLGGPKNYQIKDISIPEVKEDEVLVRVLTSGIYVSDIRDYQGCKWPYPYTGGHEYNVVIEHIRTDVDPSPFHTGNKAISYTIDDYGVYPGCEYHHENICNDFARGTAYFNENDFSGFYGFSRYAVVRARHLYIYPKETPNDEAAFTKPPVYVADSINRSHIKIGDNVVVIGGGVMGLLHILCAKWQRTRIILSGTDTKQHTFGLKPDADNVIDPLEFDPVEQVKKPINGRGTNVVESTTAIPSAATQVTQMTAKNGLRDMFSSIHPNKPILVDAGRLHSQETVATGIQNGTVETFAQTVNCISKGVIDVEPLIGAMHDYKDVVEVMECASRPNTYRVMLCSSE